MDVYERDGRYQMYAKEITLEGAGTLYERYLALKQELEDMGMFAQEYKQPIPAFIHRAGSRYCAYGSGRAGYKKYFTET